jgi:hypothetical protein
MGQMFSEMVIGIRGTFAENEGYPQCESSQERWITADQIGFDLHEKVLPLFHRFQYLCR